MMQFRAIRSFIKRYRNLRPNKQKLFDETWLKFGINTSPNLVCLQEIFGNTSSIILEIGFGNGETLFSLAKKYPEKNFIGIEVHKPGIASLLELLRNDPLKNIKIYDADANIVLQQCVPNKSIDEILILFPDPWPKRRHYKRRLIQSNFVELLQHKLKPMGTLNIVTDWEDYAKHIKEVLANNHNFSVLNPQQSTDVIKRTIITKFEQRGKNLGHKIFDFLYINT